jgi:O-antigen/teichoic acid export membrane protein
MTTRKALAFSFLDRYSALFLAIGSSAVLARLLTPAEIGIFSVTMVLLSYIGNLRDLGAGQYLLQEKELTQDRIRATWAVQLGLGLLFSLLVFLAATPVASFYGEPRMHDIMMVLAWKGFGPISLAYGNLVTTVVNAAMATFFRPPSFPWIPGVREVRRVLSFGGRVTATTIVNTFSSSAPEMLLGKLQGMLAAGLFSRANGLASMFQRLIMDATQSVALPLFAKEVRETGNTRQSFILATSYVTAIGWSFFLGVVFLAYPAIRLLYGNQWDSAVDLTRLLAVGMATGIAAALSPVALLASGRIDISVKATIYSAVQYVALIALGASLGLHYVGYAFIVANLGTASIWLVLAQKGIGFDTRLFRKTLVQSGLVALAAAIVPAAVFFWLGATPVERILPLAIAVPGSVALFLAAVVWLDHPLLREIQRVFPRLNAVLKRG